MNSHNGNGDGSAPTAGLPVYQRLAIMRRDGWEQTFATGRKVHLRTLEPAALLREGECPDILTPVLLKSLYGDNRDEEIRKALEEPFATKEHALAYVAMIDFVARLSIADDTDVADLTLAEKKLIFRFALGSAELLVTFRYEPPADVAALPQGDDVPSAAEPDIR